MKERTRIAICAPTYNDHERIRNLFTTLITFTDYPEEEYKLVMIDDGTKDFNHVKGLRELSEEFNIPLIENEENRGIPYCWNRLTEYYDAEYVILFNDDIQVKNKDWLKYFMYFMENNLHAANIGFPLIHVNANTGKVNAQYDLPDENVNPGKVGAPVGCCFGFRQDLWKQIINPDGSQGFWESLVSFYEEISFGFELAKIGSYSYMIPTPAMEHWGSQTFSNNPELAIRKICDYLPKEKYLELLKLGQEMPIHFENHEEWANKGFAYRMDYSRCMFAKKWGCKDYWKTPQAEVHKNYTDKLEPKMVKWIDKNGSKKEAIV